MRQVIQILRFATQALAILALLAWLFMGVIEASLGPGFICFSGCHARSTLIANYLAPGAVRWLIPCLALEALAVALFAVYSLTRRQARLIIAPALILVGGAVLGGAGIVGLMLLAQAALPTTPDGNLVLAAEEWVLVGDLVVMVVTVTWSGYLASLLWTEA